MPGHLPSLDEKALKRLRGIVNSMHAANGKGVPMNDLVQLARDVKIEGGLTVDFNATKELGHPMVVVRMTDAPGTQGPDPCLDVLTNREREVANLIAEGKRNKQIAAELFITEGTVKVHVNNILHKLGTRGRTEAVAFAIRNGMVRLG